MIYMRVMRWRSSRLSSLLALAALAALAVAFCPTPSSGQRPEAEPEPDVIIVLMRGLRNDRGVASAGAYASAATWTRSGEEIATCNGPVSRGISRCWLENVRPGRYAIGVMHDEDGDGQFDTGFLGIPSEGYGFSRDVRGSLGPPSFESASFEYRGGTLTIPITMRYGI